MTRFRVVRAALCVLSVLPLAAADVRPVAAQAAGSPAYSHADAIAAARRIAQGLLDEHGLPGLSLAVGVDGRIVHAEGFGWADLANRVPVTPLTRMRIGSISKPVTAAALGLLMDRGRLDLDDEIQTYVPDFPRKRWDISVRQVAGHIAGVRHYRGDENLNARRYPTVGEGLAIFAADTLLFEPGTQYSYSSYGWNLLSAVVEGASGMEFLQFMRREVFEPLGMRSIVAEHTDSIIDWHAEFYERGEGGTLLNAPHVDNSYKWAGGGFISNTEDLIRFAFAHIEGGFLQSPTVQTLWTSQRLRNGDETGYGIGWSSERDDRGRRIVSHTGGSVGGRAVLILYPEERVAVAMTSNAGHAPMSVANARRIAEAFLPAAASGSGEFRDGPLGFGLLRVDGIVVPMAVLDSGRWTAYQVHPDEERTPATSPEWWFLEGTTRHRLVAGAPVDGISGTGHELWGQPTRTEVETTSAGTAFPEIAFEIDRAVRPVGGLTIMNVNVDRQYASPFCTLGSLHGIAAEYDRKPVWLDRHYGLVDCDYQGGRLVLHGLVPLDEQLVIVGEDDGWEGTTPAVFSFSRGRLEEVARPSDAIR